MSSQVGAASVQQSEGITWSDILYVVPFFSEMALIYNTAVYVTRIAEISLATSRLDLQDLSVKSFVVERCKNLQKETTSFQNILTVTMLKVVAYAVVILPLSVHAAVPVLSAFVIVDITLYFGSLAYILPKIEAANRMLGDLNSQLEAQ